MSHSIGSTSKTPPLRKPRKSAAPARSKPDKARGTRRAHLQRIGKPVIEWSWVFEPVRLVQFLVFFTYWDVPFLLVAALARRKPMSDRANRPLVLGAFLGTLAASTLIFADLWRNIEAIVIGALLIPFIVLPGTLAGLALGWLLARILPRRTAAP